MTAHHTTDAERDLYRANGIRLAKELGAPESDVLMAYETEVERLMAGARIKDFISILAEKQVKDSFRKTHLAHGTPISS